MNTASADGDERRAGTRRSRVSLGEIVAAIRRVRWGIAAGFFIPMLASAAISLTVTSYHEAVSTLLVDVGRGAYDPVVTRNARVGQPMATNHDRLLHSELSILSSDDVIDEVISRIGLSRLYPAIAQAVAPSETIAMRLAEREFRKHLDVDVVPDSNVIRVAFEHPDSQVAAEAANGIVTAYLAHRLAIFQSPQTGSIEGRLDEANLPLKASQQAVSQFEATRGIISLDHELSLLLDQRQTIELQQLAARDDLAAANARIEALLDGRKAMKGRSAAMRDAIEADLVRARSDSRSAQARLDSAGTRLTDVAARIETLAEARTEDRMLQRTGNLAADAYAANFRELQDALATAVASRIVGTNVSIVQRASPPIESKSDRAIVLWIGFVLSVAIALIVAFVAVLVRATFAVPEGLERALGLPVLADIPAVRPERA